MTRTLGFATILFLTTTSSLYAGSDLIKAARKGNLEVIKERMAAREGVNEADDRGWTPLMWGVYYRNLPVTEYLLDHGADPNLQSTNEYKGYPKGATALIIACQDGLDDQVGILVSKKAKLDVADATGKVAADYARKNESEPVLKALGIKTAADIALETLRDQIAAGKDVNARDKYGWSALMRAVYARDQATTQFLLEKHADPNIQANEACEQMPRGVTALMITAYLGLDDLAALLVKHKAKLGLVDETGKNAEAYARYYGQTEVLNALADRSPLSKTYTKVAIEPFTAKKGISKDYAYAVRECQDSAIAVLTDKKAFEKLEMATPGKTYDASTLLVKAEVAEIRIPSGGARFFLGPAAGSTYMYGTVRLLEAATGKQERQQTLCSSNSVWLSSFTLSGTDQEFTKQMGAIIAGYVFSLNTGK